MDKKATLQDLYSWPGFRAQARTTDHVFDPLAKVVELRRRQMLFFDGGAVQRPWPVDQKRDRWFAPEPGIRANCTNLEGWLFYPYPYCTAFSKRVKFSESD